MPSVADAEAKRGSRAENAGKVNPRPQKRDRKPTAKKRRKKPTKREVALEAENERLKAEITELKEKLVDEVVPVEPAPQADPDALGPVVQPWAKIFERAPAPTGEAGAGEAGEGITTQLVTKLKDGTPLFRRQTWAAKRTGEIRIDGNADEAAWQAAPVRHITFQQRPAENVKPTGDTAFRLLYDDDAVYLSAEMQDPDPSAIAGLLMRIVGFRRVEQSDWIIAILAPQGDRSIGYAFAINPVGVKVDFRMTRNVFADETYSAIWDAAVARTPTGWRAEYRIPHSQMRVSDGVQPPWGLQVYRKYARNLERNYWSPFPTTFKQELAAMGDLGIGEQGNGKIDRGVSLEVLPYVLGGSRYERVDPANTLSQTLEPEYGIGGDAKLLVTGTLKLTASVNPDFGQIEADPSEVNLTDRETFFSERRPLFVEDADLYHFPIGKANEILFYTRRLGARPHFSQAQTSQFVDEADVTTIYGAAKLSGTIGGLRVGMLSALAAEETSRAQLMTGETQDAVVEPMTSYNTVQLGHGFRGGASDLRIAGTAVHRFLDGTKIDRLLEDAFAGAAQYTHLFADNSWSATALYGGSYLRGDPAALAVVQRASQRYMQRPDADHVDFNPERDYMTGFMFGGGLTKIAGQWRGGLTLDARSPGFETNDVGFLLDADFINPSLNLAYENVSKTGAYKIFTAGVTAQTVADFGPELLRHIGQLDTETRLRNDWLLGGSLIATRQLLDTKLLRGGPAVAGVDSGEAKLFIETAPNKSLGLRLDAAALTKPESKSFRAQASLGLTWDVLANLELAVSPTYVVNREDAQFVGAAADAMGTPHYILGRLNQRTLIARTRLNLTLTPRISIQAYAEPFLSAGDFDQFKEASNVRAPSYRDRFTALDPARITEAMGQLQIDSDGDGAPNFAVRRPDFQLGTLLTNLVFRWEYRPGSSMYVIWSQSREGAESDGVIERDDYGAVFSGRGAHVVLVKLSYWANL